jgi:DNA-binding IclR family transcriptional regulator
MTRHEASDRIAEAVPRRDDHVTLRAADVGEQRVRGKLQGDGREDGAGLRDRHGQVMGALSVTMPMGHESSEDAVRRVLNVLSETAQGMRQLV